MSIMKRNLLRTFKSLMKYFTFINKTLYVYLRTHQKLSTSNVFGEGKDGNGLIN